MLKEAGAPVAGGCCVSTVCPSVAWLLQLIGRWPFCAGPNTPQNGACSPGSPSPTVDTIFYIASINHRRQQQPTLNPFRWAATTSDRILSNVNQEIFNILTPQHHFHTKIFLKCSFEWGEKDRYLWWFPNRSKKLRLVRWLIIATRRGRGPAPGSLAAQHSCPHL